MALVGSFYRAMLRGIDPIVVPMENRRLARQVHEKPNEIVHLVDRAAAKGVAYFEQQPRLELAALFLLGRLYRTGLCPDLEFIEDRINEFAATENDPHLRLLDPDYQLPEDYNLPGPQYDQPVLRLMIRCIYADRTGETSACLEQLSKIDDTGGYGTTHIVVGGMILGEMAGVPDADVDRLCASVPQTLVAAQKVDRCGDLFAERIAVLHWLGCGDMVQPSWIMRLVRGQKRNGGWASGPSLRVAKPNQHTSALALVALVQWAAIGRNGRSFWKRNIPA